MYDLASALAAIDEIEEQGEGLKHAEVWDGDRDMFHPERDEVAHYFRFQEIARGRSYQRGDTPASGPSGPAFEVDWTRRLSDAAQPAVAGLPWRQRDCREAGRVQPSSIRTCSAICIAPSTASRERLFRTVPAMLQLKTLAQELMQMPAGDGSRPPGHRSSTCRRWRQMRAANAAFSITVLENGPYVVVGGVPINRKSMVLSELHEPLTWRKDATIESDGHLSSLSLRPVGAQAVLRQHATRASDSWEPKRLRPRRVRHAARRFVGTGITMTDDSILCMHGGFCGNHAEKVWQMMDRTDDTRVRFTVMQMVERCPSGQAGVRGGRRADRTGSARGDFGDERRSVLGDRRNPGHDVERAELEVRNRVTLCRCGQSKNKPLCDGTHAEIKFKEG